MGRRRVRLGQDAGSAGGMMKRYLGWQRDVRRGYFSPLRIPEGTSRRCSTSGCKIVEIEHERVKAGTVLPVVTHRDAIFQNKSRVDLKVPFPMTVQKLIMDGGTMMSDSPYEQEAHREALNKCRGKVLVGGLGLGYMVTMLARRRKVEHITVVENERAVIDLVWKHLRVRKAEIIHADLFDYLKQAQGRRRFSWGFYDLWGPSGERTLTKFVRPLRRFSTNVIPQNRIICWSEQTMLGQIAFNLSFVIQSWGSGPPFDQFSTDSEKEFRNNRKYTETQWPFINWMRQAKPTKKQATVMLRHYVGSYLYEREWRRVWARWEYPNPK